MFENLRSSSPSPAVSRGELIYHPVQAKNGAASPQGKRQRRARCHSGSGSCGHVTLGKTFPAIPLPNIILPPQEAD